MKKHRYIGPHLEVQLMNQIDLTVEARLWNQLGIKLSGKPWYELWNQLWSRLWSQLWGCRMMDYEET